MPHDEWSFRQISRSETPAITFRFNNSYAAERDYVFDFLRRHKIMAIEWNTVENFINWYSDRYLGQKRGDYKVPLGH